MTGAVALAGWLAFAVARWRTWAHGQVSLFIMSGVKKYSHPGQMPASISHVPLTGYDGQFYYRFALDPFDWRRTAYGVTIDHPYRYTRVGYPLLAWVSSAGQHAAAPWALVIINLACMAAIGALGGAFARDAGRHALWGLLLAGYFGMVISVGRDTSEPLADAALLGGMLAFRRQRYLLAAALLGYATVTNEPAGVVPAAIAATRLFPQGGLRPPFDPPEQGSIQRAVLIRLRRPGPARPPGPGAARRIPRPGCAGRVARSSLPSTAQPGHAGSLASLPRARAGERSSCRSRPWAPSRHSRGIGLRFPGKPDLAWLVPGCAWLALQVIEHAVVPGRAGVAANASRNLGLPFQGMKRGLAADLRGLSWAHLGVYDINLIEFIALACFVAAAALALGSSRAPAHEKAAFAGFVALEMVLATWQFWGSVFGDGRAFVEAYLLAVIVLLATPGRVVTGRRLGVLAAIAVAALVVVARRRILFE